MPYLPTKNVNFTKRKQCVYVFSGWVLGPKQSRTCPSSIHLQVSNNNYSTSSFSLNSSLQSRALLMGSLSQGHFSLAKTYMIT